MPTEEQELLLRIKGGDGAAFEELFNLYYHRIYWYIYKLVGSAEVAEDLLQNTFLRLYKGLKNYMPEGKVAAFIYTTAHNVALTWLRDEGKARKRLPHQTPRQNKEAGEAEPLDYVGDNTFRPDLMLQGKETAKKALTAINELPQVYRVTFFLVCVEGFSNEEAAEILGCSHASLRVRLSRAKRLLAKKLWSKDE
ncbi:MAG: RNA polymerase sigma factor [Candidatus Omnitrophica bacterium]|nr:RNA polymerase sigma factor [Candidatus Omnitrophota bacterium]